MSLTKKYLWVEKYRPENLEEVVISEEYRNGFAKYIRDKEIPHLLLIGIQGSGKTTIARILIGAVANNIDDVLEINGSTKTGVDVIRDTVEEFLKTPTFSGRGIKIVFIDEFDYMSQNAQAALRNMLEKYHEVGRFIFTANYRSKIIQPLFSRVSEFKFKKLPKEFVLKYAEDVLKAENIEYEEAFVDKVVGMYYPDVRKVINTLQTKVDDNKLMSDFESLMVIENQARSFVTDLCLGLKDSNTKMINVSVIGAQKLLRDNEMDYISLYNDLFDDDQVPLWAKVVINKYANNHMECMIPAMHFMGMLYEIGKTGKEFYTLKR